MKKREVTGRNGKKREETGSNQGYGKKLKDTRRNENSGKKQEYFSGHPHPRPHSHPHPILIGDGMHTLKLELAPRFQVPKIFLS